MSYIWSALSSCLSAAPQSWGEPLRIAYFELEATNKPLINRRIELSLLLEALWEGSGRNPDALIAISDSLRECQLDSETLETSLRTSAGTIIPSFTETVVATCKRLDALLHYFRQIQEVGPFGFLVVGSVGYGKFYSIRDNTPSSDIDLVIIFDPIQQPIQSRWHEKISPLHGTPNIGMQTLPFEDGLMIFDELHRRGEADSFIYKFELDSGIELSLTIAPSTVFRSRLGNPFLNNNQLSPLHNDPANEFRLFTLGHLEKWVTSMRGLKWRIEVPEQSSGTGYIATYPGSSIRSDGTFFPGEYTSFFAPYTDPWHSTSQDQSEFSGYCKFLLQEEASHFVYDPNTVLARTHSRHPGISAYSVLKARGELPEFRIR